jgi:hypothetical protein
MREAEQHLIDENAFADGARDRNRAWDFRIKRRFQL